jgi:hypothetical protein
VELEELNQELELGMQDIAAGRVIPAEALLDKLKAKR